MEVEERITWLSNDGNVPFWGEIVTVGERREMVKLVSSMGKRGGDPGQKWKDQLSREARIEYCLPRGLREVR